MVIFYCHLKKGKYSLFLLLICIINIKHKPCADKERKDKVSMVEKNIIQQIYWNICYDGCAH